MQRFVDRARNLDRSIGTLLVSAQISGARPLFEDVGDIRENRDHRICVWLDERGQGFVVRRRIEPLVGREDLQIDLLFDDSFADSNKGRHLARPAFRRLERRRSGNAGAIMQLHGPELPRLHGPAGERAGVEKLGVIHRSPNTDFDLRGLGFAFGIKLHRYERNDWDSIVSESKPGRFHVDDGDLEVTELDGEVLVVVGDEHDPQLFGECGHGASGLAAESERRTVCLRAK